MDLTVIVTAREGSTRIPRKPFITVGADYLINTLLDNLKTLFPTSNIVLTSESPNVLQTFGRAKVIPELTASSIKSGTERAAHIARIHKSSHYLVVPCDIWIKDWSALATYVERCFVMQTECATLSKSEVKVEDLSDTGKVKGITDVHGHALFFSRKLEGPLEKYGRGLVQQLGVYFYTKESLDFFYSTPPTLYEVADNNESFRFLLSGRKMLCVDASSTLFSLNTNDDLALLSAAEGLVIGHG